MACHASAEEFFSSIRQEIYTVLVLKLDLLPIPIEQRSVKRMRGMFERIRSLPQVKKAAAILGLHIARAATILLCRRRQMPLTNQV